MFMKYVSHVVPKSIKPIVLGANAVWVGTLQALPNYVCRSRVLDDYYMIYISKGSGEFRCNKKKYSIKKGDILFLFPGVIHSYKTDSKDLMEQWWIGYNGTLCKKLLETCHISPLSPILSVSDDFEDVLALMKKCFDETEHIRPGTSLICSAIIYQLFGIFLNRTHLTTGFSKEIVKRDEHPIERAISYLEANYVNNITIDHVANYSSLSKAYFTTRFTKEVGISPKAYLTKLRIEQAKYFLTNSSLSVKDIANAVGFQDPLYFSKVFNKSINYSPSEYRNQSIDNKMQVGNKSSL